jgi:hypothetical protein
VRQFAVRFLLAHAASESANDQLDNAERAIADGDTGDQHLEVPSAPLQVALRALRAIDQAVVDLTRDIDGEARPQRD